ncbi:MAG: hypothetical protein ABF479_14955, partial [Gluconacetobacter sp.]
RRRTVRGHPRSNVPLQIEEKSRLRTQSAPPYSASDAVTDHWPDQWVHHARGPPFTFSSGNRHMFSSISSVGSSALDSLYGTSSTSSSTGSSSDMSSSSSTTTTSQIANSDGSISIVTKDAQGNIISESTTGSQNASANSDSVDLYA